MANNNVEILKNAQGIHAKSINFNTSISSPPAVGPLEKLEARIAPGAIHDSTERSHAPLCHPETRVAVQKDLYRWVVDGNPDSSLPRKMKWVTGPAGSGKTAVMGSLAVRCAADGILGATFFASWSASVDRRRKTALVTTMAYQLAEYREDLKIAISNAIERNPSAFKKNLHVQMETFILGPLREVALRSDRPPLRGVIIIDGVDECEAEQLRDNVASTSSPNRTVRHTAEQDQLEILQVLQAASSDPSFPFRILIASRPERIFREFFDPERDPNSFSQKVDLHEDYNADADIALFLNAEFNFIRRRYKLPYSWPPPETIRALVDKASGQFIYAATVIRFLDVGQREPSKALELILKTEAKPTSNPLEQLDVLYSHILESSPDPRLSVLWIRSIILLDGPEYLTAFNLNQLLQTDPESSEAEHLLGSLHSLIRIPPTNEQRTASYRFYHKSLFDFLANSGRCGKLYYEAHEVYAFIWDAVVRACSRASDVQFSFPDSFLELLADIPAHEEVAPACGHSEVRLKRANTDWWVSTAISYKFIWSLWYVFREAHNSNLEPLDSASAGIVNLDLARIVLAAPKGFPSGGQSGISSVASQVGGIATIRGVRGVNLVLDSCMVHFIASGKLG